MYPIQKLNLKISELSDEDDELEKEIHAEMDERKPIQMVESLGNKSKDGRKECPIF